MTTKLPTVGRELHYDWYSQTLVEDPVTRKPLISKVYGAEATWCGSGPGGLTDEVRDDKTGDGPSWSGTGLGGLVDEGKDD